MPGNKEAVLTFETASLFQQVLLELQIPIIFLRDWKSRGTKFFNDLFFFSFQSSRCGNIVWNGSFFDFKFELGIFQMHDRVQVLEEKNDKFKEDKDLIEKKLFTEITTSDNSSST